jgi:hypothetical protein
METMLNPDEQYPFDNITIKTPKAVQGGSYCANLEIYDGPVIIQTPRCKTKNGIHKTAKQLYCDLVLNQDNSQFLEWLEKLQEKVRSLIFDNSSKWFHDNPTMDEIEYNWNNCIRTKKDTCLIRTFVHKTKGISKISLQIYDSDENQLDVDQLDNKKSVICILEIIGLKFSANSFHLEICLRQVMVMVEKPLYNKCLIKLNKPVKIADDNGANLESKITVDTQLLSNNDDVEINKESQPVVKKIETIEEKNEVLEENNEDAEENNEDAEENEVVKGVNVENIVDENMTDEKIMDKDTSVEIPTDNVIRKRVLINKEIEVINSLEKNDDDYLEEIELIVPEEEPMKLKNPNEVYLDIYKVAREKAKKAKNEAIKAYLEAKRIKELYMLDIIDSSSDEDDSEDDEELFSKN